MQYYCYILFSEKLNKFYIGSTQDLDNRLYRHNNSAGSTYTKKVKDWKLMYFETFETRSEAIMRENQIKRKKSRKYIEWIIANSDHGAVG